MLADDTQWMRQDNRQRLITIAHNKNFCSGEQIRLQFKGKGKTKHLYFRRLILSRVIKLIPIQFSIELWRQPLSAKSPKTTVLKPLHFFMSGHQHVWKNSCVQDKNLVHKPHYHHRSMQHKYRRLHERVKSHLPEGSAVFVHHSEYSASSPYCLPDL